MAEDLRKGGGGGHPYSTKSLLPITDEESDTRNMKFRNRYMKVIEKLALEYQTTNWVIVDQILQGYFDDKEPGIDKSLIKKF
jgi:hypothetical protein